MGLIALIGSIFLSSCSKDEIPGINEEIIIAKNSNSNLSIPLLVSYEHTFQGGNCVPNGFGCNNGHNGSLSNGDFVNGLGGIYWWEPEEQEIIFLSDNFSNEQVVDLWVEDEIIPVDPDTGEPVVELFDFSEFEKDNIVELFEFAEDEVVDTWVEEELAQDLDDDWDVGGILIYIITLEDDKIHTIHIGNEALRSTNTSTLKIHPNVNSTQLSSALGSNVNLAPGFYGLDYSTNPRGTITY